MKSRSLALLSAIAMVASLLIAVPGLAVAPASAQTSTDLATLVLNAGSGDTIELAEGDYFLDGPLLIDKNLTVRGTAEKASLVRIHGQSARGGDRVIDIASGDVTLENLQITGGDTGAKGGGIQVQAGAVLHLIEVEVVGNQADEGGGIYNAGTATITHSLIYQNSARRKGGGIENDGSLTVVNSTITDNVGKGGGGLSTAGTADLAFVTVFGNRSTNKIGAGTLRNGGNLAIRNSIVANNIGSDGDFHDCSGTPNLDYVIVSSDQGCNPEGFYEVHGPPAVVVEELPPVDNGGPTLTLALPEDSPAIDFAGVICFVADDQRGVDRDDFCDLGAYEFVFDQTPPAVNLTVDPVANGAGWHTGEVIVTVNATDADSNVESVTYSALGADPIGATTETGATASFVVDAEGTTTVSASALDGAGNTGFAVPLDVKIDLTDPTVVFSAADPDPSTGDVEVTLSPADTPSGVAEFTYTVDGITTTLTDPQDWPVVLTIANSGPTTIAYAATDVAGNTTGPLSDTVAIDPLTLDLTLSTSATSVQVGAVSAPLESIVAGVAQISEQGTPVESTPFSAIPFSAITIEDAPFSAIPFSAIPFSAIPFSAIPFSAIGDPENIPFSIPFSAIPFSAIPFSAIPFSAIDLSGTPFSAIGLDSVLLSELSTPDGQSLDVYMAGTPLEDTPLQALNLSDLMSVPFSAITLNDSPFSAIPFSAIPFSAIDLSGVPFSAIPFSAIGDVVDCDALEADLGKACELATIAEGEPYLILDGANSKLTIGDVLGFDDVNLNSTVLASLPFSAIALGSVSLNGLPFSAIGTGGTELFDLEGWCDYLGPDVCSAFGIDASTGNDNGVGLLTLALSGVDLNSVPFSAIDLEGLPFSAIPLGLVPFSAINFGNTPFSAIGDIVDCAVLEAATGIPCLDATLADAYTSGALLDLTGYSLADLMFGLLPPEDLPWIEVEDLNAIRLPVADGTQDSFEYLVDFTVGNRNADVEISLTLPVGFVPTGDPATISTGGTIAWTEAAPGVGGNPPIVLEFDSLTALDPGDYTIALPVWAGVVLGEFTAAADATATRSTGADSASDSAAIIVVEAGEIAGTAFPSLIGTLGGCSFDSNLEISHISTVDDVDIYSFQVPDGCTGGQIEILMTNLGADLDLTLLGPPATENYLRGEPRTGYGYIEDHSYDLNPDDDSLDADVLRDIPIDPVKLNLPADLVPIAVSANRGTADEQLEARTPRADRDYFLVTSGYNGASTNLPFGLQAQFEGSEATTCDLPAIPWTATSTPPPGLGGLPSDLNTLFLYNAGWLEGSSDPAAADVLSALANVGSQQWIDLGVTGAAIPVDANGAIATALGAWYSSERCNPEAANDIVRLIGQLIDSYTQAFPSVQNIVIVGDDVQVPFARLVDNVTYSNETDHAGTIPVPGELQSALAGGYYFSDDPYGSSAGIKIADGEFFVPERAVGRLVETPAQILSQFNQFLGYSGVLDPTTGDGTLAAAAGYDFLKDGVDEIVANMTADGFDFGSRVLNELDGLGNLWDAQDLVDLLATPALSAASINAHFDQYRSLPAEGNATGDETDLFVVGDTDIGRALLFSMGCHAGLSVSNVQIGANPVWASDWAESFGGLGDLWIGNSGFGYGDSAMVAYSEAVSAAFADFIGTNTVGQAWMLAKQDFASGLFVVSPYHTKSMNEWILYGFPMFRTSADIPVQPELPVVGSGPGVIPDPYGSTLEIAPVGLASTGLQLQTTGAGNFYSGNAGTLEVRGRAVSALAGIDVTIPDGLGGLDKVAGGAIVTGLTSEEEAFTPLIFNPIVDLGDGENPSATTSERFPVPEAVFPAGLSQIVDFLDEGGQLRQKLLLAGTRFDPQGTGSTGTLEKFTSFEATVYYRPEGSSDTTPPLIRLADGVSDGKIAFFEIDVAGDEGPIGVPDDVLRVNVLFGPANPNGEVTWRSIDLVRVGTSTTWVGGAPVDPLWGSAASEYAFWVQTCDLSANCGSSTAKGVYFATTDTGGGDVIDIKVYDAGTTNIGSEVGGWFGGPVDAAATSTAGFDIDRYVLDGVEVDPTNASSITIPISANGGHFLLVYDTEGNVGARLLAIDDAPPVAAHEIDPDPINGYSSPLGTQILITALDPFGSGVDRIEYSFDGFGAVLSQTGPAASVSVTSTSDLSYRAVDRVGNTSSEVVVNVPIDSTAPVVIVSPGDGISQGAVDGGWSTASPVLVALAASDDEVGIVESVEYTLDGSTWSEYSDPFDVTNEGTTTIGVQSTDAFGNSGGSGDVTVRIDTVKPIVSIALPAGPYEVGQAVSADYSCDDPGDDSSGIDTCVGDVADGAPVDTSTLGEFTFTVTATDVAGNVTVETSDYSVVDTDAPEIVIITPSPDGTAAVTIGSTDTLADFVCTDSVDPDPTCTATVGTISVASGDALPSQTPGQYTLTVTATDASGNQAVAEATYTVKYAVCLDYNPNKPQPATGAVAIKVFICDAGGNNLSDPAVDLTAEEIVVLSNGDTFNPGPNDTGDANDDFLFRFASDRYIYNLNTTEVTDESGDFVPLGPGEYLFRFSVSTTGDILYDAPFKLK